MHSGDLGKEYQDREIIIRQGETGDHMYVIQSGEVEVIREIEGKEVYLTTLKAGDVFGEMAIFEREVRSATVRALGETRVLSVDKRNFLRRVHEDPSFAFRILQKMSQHIRRLSDELASLKTKA